MYTSDIRLVLVQCLSSIPAARRPTCRGRIELRYICIYIHQCLLAVKPGGRPKYNRPQFQVSDQLTTDATGAFSSSLTRNVPVPVNGTNEDLDNIPLSTVQGFKQPALPWYADQCLPFDVTIACGNEYGAAASAKLFGVEILNEGFGASVDDSVLEQQATFIARSVLPLQAVGRSNLIKL